MSTSKQEEMIGAVPWYFDVVRGPIEMIDGFWQVRLRRHWVSRWTKPNARHPFAPEVPHAVNAMLDDGAIVEW